MPPKLNHFRSERAHQNIGSPFRREAAAEETLPGQSNCQLRCTSLAANIIIVFPGAQAFPPAGRNDMPPCRPVRHIFAISLESPALRSGNPDPHRGRLLPQASIRRSAQIWSSVDANGQCPYPACIWASSQFQAGGYLDIKVTNLAPRSILRVRLRAVC